MHVNHLESSLNDGSDSLAGKGMEFGAFCTSNKLMCAAHAAGVGPHFEYKGPGLPRHIVMQSHTPASSNAF